MFHFVYRVLKSVKNANSLPLASNLPICDGEIILDVDGNIPIQPVLQHIGTSAWPGELFIIVKKIFVFFQILVSLMIIDLVNRAINLNQPSSLF